MNVFKFYQYLVGSFILVATLSCGSDPVEVPLGEFEKGVLIINEGAFGTNDGEIYHYNREAESTTPNVFEHVNSRPFAGLIQQLTHHESYFYMVANTGKVEIVNDSDFKSVGSVISERLVIPRALAVAGQKLFISDYGPYDEQWNNPNSFIAVVEGKEGGIVGKTISVPSQPEGLAVVGEKLWVACAAGNGVVVIDPQTEEVVANVPLPKGSPYSFFNYNGLFYVYARSATDIYFYILNSSNFSVTSMIEIPVANSIYNGNYALGEGGKVYIIQNSGASDRVVTVSLTTGEVLNENLYQGSNFYGLGYDTATKDLYIGDHAGWQSNGKVLVVNEQGALLKTLEVGKGPSGFVFR